MKVTIEFNGPADEVEAKKMLVDNLGMLAYVIGQHVEKGRFKSMFDGEYGVYHEDGYSTVITRVEP